MKKTSIDSVAQEHLDAISKELEKMESIGVLPLIDKRGEKDVEYTRSSLQKDIDELKNTKLTIAICGAVKAGKSTFLNSLLFGKEVLPVMSTPCTTKLTFITHTDGRNSFEVDFFSKDNYNQMKSKLDEKERKELEYRENRAVNSGISPNQLWGTQKTGSGENDFEELEQYVSTDGDYVPFVEKVTLKINRKELENLYIVDTPGLDDPNPLNSMVTEEWAQKAHAVIYLTTWKGLGQCDRDFIEQNFGELCQESNNRVFVITQIDQNEDWVNVQNKFKKDFPKEKDNVCGYSGYIDLLQKRRERGEDLSEDDEYVLNNLDPDFNYDPRNVSKLVAERLYNGGIKIKAKKCADIIYGCYKIYINQCKKRKNELEIKERDLHRSVEEAKQAIENLEKCRRELESRTKNILNSARSKITGIQKFEEKKGKILDDIYRNVERIISTSNSDNKVIANSYIATTKAQSILRIGLEKHIEKFVNATKERFNDVRQALSVAVESAGCENEIIEPDSSVIDRLGKDLIDKTNINVNIDAINNDIHWYISTSKNAAMAQGVISNAIDKAINDTNDAVIKFTLECKKAIALYIDETNQNVEKRLEDLKALKSKSPKEKEEQLQNVKTELVEITKRLEVAENAEKVCQL